MRAPLFAIGAACIVAACSSDSSGNGAGTSDGGGGGGGTTNDAGGGGGGGTEAGGGGGGGTEAGGGGGSSLTSFPSTSIIYQDISSAPVDAAWNAILKGALASGWGSPFQLDPSFTVGHADATVVPRAFTQDPSAQPDCDTAPVPVPAGGKTEGEANYECTGGGDCHLLVFQGTRLYELYQGSITGGQATGGTFTGSCLAVWDLTRDYWQPGATYARGDGCNGADAADMPVAPLLLTKAEVAAHAIKHAMRFTIDNSKIDNTNYVHPATHLGGSGPSGTTLPYGARLRLKSSYNVASLGSAEAQAVAVALQKYGMFMDDGGNFFVSGTTDVADVIDTHALKALLPTDFEMVDGGTRINFHKQNCTRTVISQ